MARKKTKTVDRKKRASQAPPPAPKPRKQRTRRDVINLLTSVVGGAVVLGGGGWYLASEVSASIAEGDLSKIGNGIPTIVQVHDPQCQLCLKLQRETRSALSEFDNGDLQYLVANIKQSSGRRFASAHGVGNVTLILFDGDGTKRDVIAGTQTSAFLEHAFRQHLSRAGS